MNFVNTNKNIKFVAKLNLVLMNEKKCSCCQEIKSVDKFHKNLRLKSGLQSSCKDCISKRRKLDNYAISEANRLNNYKNNGVLKQRQKDYYQNVKMIYNIRTNEAIKSLTEQGFVKVIFHKSIYINNNGDLIKLPALSTFLKMKYQYKLINITPRLRVNGYYAVHFYGREYRIHQLVAIHFLGHIPNKHSKVIDHIDGNKLNNNVNNLQIIGNYQNMVKGKYYKSKETQLLKYLNGIELTQ